MVYRLRQAVRFHGVRGALRWALVGVARRVVFDERHVWYKLDTAGERPRPQLPWGLTLRRAEQSDLALLRELDTVSPGEARARLGAGNDLWLVLEDGRPLFSCFIFRDHSPAVAASGGWFPLPSDTVCQDDSVTAPAARGRGIAPAAWAAIADVLASEGQRHLIRKVEVANAPSQRAGEKVGFKPVARMHFRRIGPVSRTSVAVLDQELGPMLAQRLDSRKENGGGHA